MTEPAYDTVAWFEVATDDPDAAERFYGELFGWSFASSMVPEADYREITCPGAEAPSGGLFNTKGGFPGHAVFSVPVRDVTKTCERVESLGGEVVQSVVGQGEVDFAYVRDTSGNLFGIFARP